ncbi:TetR/AcrR family transcriptional regulator [Chachezhania sediminis]|uniref:TetR/AcrR family transcriptional regulator n=1 Tax=Chachezhania sediminis TaxID=2599291 RepID=UPI00131C7F64|nr:TetR/AcrR family transcriptional regulator [Chachezhania sediminis]
MGAGKTVTGKTVASPARDPDRKVKSDVTRQKVLTAAARLFSERGFAGATMRDIAAAADMRAGSLYYHFPSKTDLIEVVLDHGVLHVSTAVEQAMAALPPSTSCRARIRVAIAAHLDSILQNGAFASLSRHLQAQVPDEIRRRHVERRDAYSAFWLDLLQAAVDAGEIRADLDIRLTRTFLLGALNAALDWYRPDGKPVETLAEEFTAILGEGMFVPVPPAR